MVAEADHWGASFVALGALVAAAVVVVAVRARLILPGFVLTSAG